MQETLDGKYTMILKKEMIDRSVTPEHIKKLYHTFCANSSYYMSNSVHTNELKEITDKISNNLKDNHAFAKEVHKLNKHKIIVFIPIENISGKSIGYFISIREDNTIQEIYISEFIKFLIGAFLILVIFYFIDKIDKKLQL